MVHTNSAAKSGLLALETFTGHGVDPRRMVIAHAGDSNDLGYLREIADTGAALGFDRFNIPSLQPRRETASRRSSRCSPRATWTGSTSPTTRRPGTTSCSTTRRSRTRTPDYLHIEREVLPEAPRGAA